MGSIEQVMEEDIVTLVNKLCYHLEIFQ